VNAHAQLNHLKGAKMENENPPNTEVMSGFSTQGVELHEDMY